MFELIESMMSYPFMVRAITVGILVSLCAALLGVSMVLKRYSMIGDGLSHVGFAALAAAAATGLAPLKVAIPVCIVAAFLILRLSENSKLKGDSAVAILCSGSLAIGVMIISLSSGMNMDVSNYMFGSIYTVSVEDMVITVALSVVVLVLYVVFYNKLFAVTFDEEFAAATGVKTEAYNTLLACLTAITIVVGMRMMGALLISSLIIFPVLTASRVCKNYRAVIFTSVGVSVFNFIAGLVLSIVINASPGSSVVIVSLAIFVIFTIVGRFLKEN